MEVINYYTQNYNKEIKEKGEHDMDVNKISQLMVANYEVTKVNKDEEKKSTESLSEKQKEQDENIAAEYTKSNPSAVEHAIKHDNVTIEKLKAEAELRTAQLRSVVEKMMLKQGQQFTTLSDAFDMIEEGIITVDDEVAKEAAEEISEDGYWGVNQTSDRLFSFAKALAGNNPANADKMLEALQKGYDAATASWGGELPELCKQTLEATQKKLTEWRDSLNAENEPTDTTQEATKTE